MANIDILLVGASGRIGRSLLPALEAHGRVIPVHFSDPAPETGHPWKQLRGDDVSALLEETSPRLIVNAAALAAPSACHADPELARRLNVELPRALAESGKRMIHLSTDQVFDGTRGQYAEEDSPGPISVYGSTKLEGEHAVRAQNENSVILRVNLVCGRSIGPRKTSVDNMLAAAERGEEIRLFADEYRSPVALTDVVLAVQRLVDSEFKGLLHLGGPRLSRLELGRPILENHGYGHLVRVASVEDYEGPPRPRDTSFDSSLATIELGFTPRDLDGIVGDC